MWVFLNGKYESEKVHQTERIEINRLARGVKTYVCIATSFRKEFFLVYGEISYSISQFVIDLALRKNRHCESGILDSHADRWCGASESAVKFDVELKSVCFLTITGCPAGYCR